MNFIFRKNMTAKFIFRNEIVSPYKMTDENDYEYEITENSVTITKYIGSAKNIEIPQKIEIVKDRSISDNLSSRISRLELANIT